MPGIDGSTSLVQSESSKDLSAEAARFDIHYRLVLFVDQTQIGRLNRSLSRSLGVR